MVGWGLTQELGAFSSSPDQWCFTFLPASPSSQALECPNQDPPPPSISPQKRPRLPGMTWDERSSIAKAIKQSSHDFRSPGGSLSPWRRDTRWRALDSLLLLINWNTCQRHMLSAARGYSWPWNILPPQDSPLLSNAHASTFGPHTLSWYASLYLLSLFKGQQREVIQARGIFKNRSQPCCNSI